MDVVEEFNENNRIWALLDVIPVDRHTELAELCSEFCRKHSLFLNFISHTMQHEIHITSTRINMICTFSLRKWVGGMPDQPICVTRISYNLDHLYLHLNRTIECTISRR